MQFYGTVSGFNHNKTIFLTCVQRSRTEQLQTALDVVERGVECVSRGRARSLYGGSDVFDEVFTQARRTYHVLLTAAQVLLPPVTVDTISLLYKMSHFS